MKRLSLVAFITCALFLSACSALLPPETLTADDFQLRMEEDGHQVENITHQHRNEQGVETVHIADLDDFFVFFIVYETVEYALSAHHQLRQTFEDRHSSGSFTSRVDMPSFNRFSQTAGGQFEALLRVSNTLVIIEASVEYRDEARAVLSRLG